tara:strand:- start:288 stop:515 length:228 start_codon:yes stop_codon:yes gene_type:complete
MSGRVNNMEMYILVISLWGFNGTEWEYVGNQAVYQQPMYEDGCEEMIEDFTKYESNEFYRISLDCKSAGDVKGNI